MANLGLSLGICRNLGSSFGIILGLLGGTFLTVTVVLEAETKET